MEERRPVGGYTKSSNDFQEVKMESNSTNPVAPPDWSNTSLDILLKLHPFVISMMREKIFGTVIGSAVGDAIGLYTEFLSKSTAQKEYPGSDFRFSLVHPRTPRRHDHHRQQFKLGSWTDDTDHALLILLSYLHHDGVLDPIDFARRLQVWCNEGLLCLGTPAADIGITTQNVVLDEKFLENPYQVAYDQWVRSGCKAAANGSLMRTHSLGIICITMSLEETFRTACKFSRLTHPDPRCIVACCICTALIRGILRGEITSENSVGMVIRRAFEWVKSWIKYGGGDEKLGSHENIPMHLDKKEFYKHVGATSLQELHLDDPDEMGYVYKALGAAILLLRLVIRRVVLSLNTFEPLIQELIMEGGDADTNACIAGALVGCWVGYMAIPSKWRLGIQNRQWLLEKTAGLCQTLGVSKDPPEYKGSNDLDTRIDGGKNHSLYQ
jgi:ADP-ribosylglycohydrolase